MGKRRCANRPIAVLVAIADLFPRARRLRIEAERCANTGDLFAAMQAPVPVQQQTTA
jgi:hypothetical protein